MTNCQQLPSLIRGVAALLSFTSSRQERALTSPQGPFYSLFTREPEEFSTSTNWAAFEYSGDPRNCHQGSDRVLHDPEAHCEDVRNHSKPGLEDARPALAMKTFLVVACCLVAYVTAQPPASPAAPTAGSAGAGKLRFLPQLSCCVGPCCRVW